MDEIIETAEKTLRKSGYTYGASARLANVDFPDENVWGLYVSGR